MSDKKQKQAIEAALRLLSHRSQTEAQIREKLARKGFESIEIDPAVSYLKEINFIDDQKYADDFIRISMSYKPKGKYRLRMELKNKGVAPELIENSLEALEQDESLTEQALGSFLRKNKHLEREKFYTRAMSFLLRRGFSLDEAKKAVAKSIAEIF